MVGAALTAEEAIRVGGNRGGGGVRPGVGGGAGVRARGRAVVTGKPCRQRQQPQGGEFGVNWGDHLDQTTK